MRVVFHHQYHSAKSTAPRTYEVVELGARLEGHLIFLQNRAIETQLLGDVPET